MISHLAKLPMGKVVPRTLAKAVAQQPGAAFGALERMSTPFSTQAKKARAHTIPVEENKETTETPSTSPYVAGLERMQPGRHPFWSHSLWDADDFFHPSNDPFAHFFGRSPFWRPTPWRLPSAPHHPQTGLALLRSSPGYDWQQHDDHIELAVQVPEGVDAKVEVDDESRELHIHGKHVEEEDDGTYHRSLRFDQRFILPQNADLDNIKARVEGLLKVTVPTIAAKPKRSIVVEKQIPTEDEIKQATYGDEFDESDWVETGKKAA